MAFTVLFDANVLYSAPVRDVVARLALADLFRARWSRDIHREWMAALASQRPDIPYARIERTRALLDEHARDALVEGYESLIPSLTLPDPNDRHVLAAAIVGRADLILTYNLADFPTATLEPHGIEVQHPDEFLVHQFHLAPALVLTKLAELRRGLTRPPLTPTAYLEKLVACQLAQFVEQLRPHLGEL